MSHIIKLERTSDARMVACSRTVRVQQELDALLAEAAALLAHSGGARIQFLGDGDVGEAIVVHQDDARSEDATLLGRAGAHRAFQGGAFMHGQLDRCRLSSHSEASILCSGLFCK